MKNIFRVLFACLLVFNAFSLSSIANADETYNYVTQWGSQEFPKDAELFPQAVAAGPSGDIFIANFGGVAKFNSKGQYFGHWGWTNYTIYHITADLSGNVYISDTDGGLIRKYDSNGNLQSQWGNNGAVAVGRPLGLAVDKNKNLYVVDGGSRIQKYDSNGNLLTQWGSAGSGNGQFNLARDVAVDPSGNVYVVDTYNSRIQKFDPKGNYLTQWGSPGLGNGQFSVADAAYLAIDSSGNVFISDSAENRIQKFDSNGTYITQWGKWGTENGQFDGPRGIAVDSSGNVYVADANNKRIQIFSLSATTTTTTLSTTTTTTTSTPTTMKTRPTLISSTTRPKPIFTTTTRAIGNIMIPPTTPKPRPTPTINPRVSTTRVAPATIRKPITVIPKSAPKAAPLLRR